MGGPFDPNGTYGRLAYLGLEWFSMNGGSSWNPEYIRTFCGKMIRPNFVTGADVGVISIDQPPANLPSSFAPVVTFGSFANHPSLPNLVTFGKVYVIDNATNQTVRYSERRVFLQNAPYTATITFDNFSGLSAGSYTIKAVVERPDDENLINNEYSRQYTKTFAPIVVNHNGRMSASEKAKLAEGVADMGSEVRFVDRTQPGWSMPQSGSVLWSGAISPRDAEDIRAFVKKGNFLAVLPTDEIRGDIQTGVFTSLATAKETESMASAVTAGRTAEVPSFVMNSEMSSLVFNGGLTLGRTQEEISGASAILGSRLVDLQTRLANIERMPKASDPNRPVSWFESDEISVQGLRLGSLSVAQVISRKTDAPRQVVEAISNPSDFEITQNYPNPFNPSTTIAYNVPRESQVTLRVFDMLGRRIATLVNGSQPSGAFTVTWDGRSDDRVEMTSGVYFYHIEASPVDGSAPFTATKKMILAR